ncbi:MAG: glutathione S-transferase [Methylococcaceae bacterium]|nr:glutathione S-transferase [Methylococcaceae bacterium]
MSALSAVPILYSFRRCPYAMRARLAIAYAGIAVTVREIKLSAKPQSMLDISPKGTVPVLQLRDGTVLDESLDIMNWALQQNDPEHWLEKPWRQTAEALIQQNDGAFKYCLDRYKYPDRYPEYPARHYRQQGELFLAELERRLTQTPYLCGEHFSLADAAIAPFIRQFVAVDSAWFAHAAYPVLQQWLSNFLATQLFAAVMVKYPLWMPDPLVTEPPL